MISIQTRDFPKLVYRKSGKGPVIMLLHGFPENGEMWNSVCESLADKYTVIVPDIPGSGDSSFKGEKLSLIHI